MTISTPTLHTIQSLDDALEMFIDTLLPSIVANDRLPFHPTVHGFESQANYSPIRFLRQFRTDRYYAERPYGAWIESGAAWLRERFSAEQLPNLAADMFFHPELWWEGCSQLPFANRAEDLPLLKHTILARVLVDTPSADIAERLAARITRMTLDWQPVEIPAPAPAYIFHGDEINGVFFPPNLRECVELLHALPPTPAILDLIVRLWTGGFDVHLPALQRGSQPGLVSQERSINANFLPLARRLAEAGRLDYDLFYAHCGQRPAVLLPLEPDLLRQSKDLPPDLKETLAAFRDRLLDAAAEDLAPALHREWFRWCRTLEGPTWLLHAARFAAKTRLKKPLVDVPRYDKDRLPRESQVLLWWLRARIHYPPYGSEPDRASLVAHLRSCPPSGLKALLPQSWNGRWLLLEALEWQAGIPLLEQYDAAYRTYTLYLNDQWTTDWLSGVPECADPRVGVLDVAAVRRAGAAACPALTAEILDLFRQARQLPRLTMLFQALFDLNRPEVMARLEKQENAAIRAYGLLPLVRAGEGDERREVLQQIGSDLVGKKRPTQKESARLAAVQVALANLAQVDALAGQIEG